MSDTYKTPSNQHHNQQEVYGQNPQFQGHAQPIQQQGYVQPYQAPVQPEMQPSAQPGAASMHTQLGHVPAPPAYSREQVPQVSPIPGAGQYPPSQTYQAAPQAYQAAPQTYQAAPQTYQAAPQVYQAAPQTYQAASQAYQAAPQAYQVGPSQTQEMPEQYASHPPHQSPSGAAPPVFSRSATTDTARGAPPRVRFIRMVYLHLSLAIFGFTAMSYLLRTNETIYKLISFPIIKFAILGSSYNWGIFLLLFVAVGWVADKWAQRRGAKLVQYLGLGLYVLAEAVIFLPLLYIAELKGAKIMAMGGGEVHFVRDAAFITLALFGALTASVFITKKDFSFLRSGLMMMTAGATVLIFLSIGAGFSLGMVFAFAMVILAGGYVLYYTSQILRNYHTDSYVAASLALFSAIALMFWYIIQLVMNMRD